MKAKKTNRPKAPTVQEATWKALYDASSAFYKSTPWSFINEKNIFALEDPFLKKTGYLSILGEDEDFLGLIIYRGRDGLETCLDLQSGKILPDDPEIINNYDALVLEFVEKKMLDKEELKVIKKLNPSLSKETLIPSFRSYIPGFQGWYLTEEEASFLLLALKCAIEHTEQKKYGQIQENDSKQTLFYIPEMKNEQEISWQTSWHTPGPLIKKQLEPIPLNKGKIEALKGIKLYHDGGWEASIFNTPNIIYGQNRPYFAKVCMIVHQESLLVLQVKIIEGSQCLRTFLCEEILSLVSLHKRIPAEIFFNNKEFYEAAKPLAKALGIQATLSPFLPATAPAQESLIQYIK